MPGSAVFTVLFCLFTGGAGISCFTVFCLFTGDAGISCFYCNGVTEYDPNKCWDPTTEGTIVQECAKGDWCEVRTSVCPSSACLCVCPYVYVCVCVCLSRHLL